MKQALLFCGQGAQYVGMGLDLYKAFRVAKDVFDEVDEALHLALSKIIFQGQEEELTRTQNAQPALMAVSIALWRVLQTESDISITDFIYTAGHSLGMYSALCASEALCLTDTALLLRQRGEAMAQACQSKQGSMAVVLGLEKEVVSQIAQETHTYIANDNAIGQQTISGTVENIEKACVLALERQAKRAMPLKVAGAFHSPLMQEAQDKMQEVILSAQLKTPKIPVISNLTAEPLVEVNAIKQDLIFQITGQVQWTQTQHFLKKEGVEAILELGAGKVLAGLLKRTEPSIVARSLYDVETVKQFLRKDENV